MHTKALYYVFADIFVPFFVNLAHFQKELYGYQPYLVSFTPRERAILKKNGQHFSPASLAEIEEQPETTMSLGDADVTDLFAFMHTKHKGSLAEWKNRTIKIANYLDGFISKNDINLIVVWNGQDHVARALTEIAKRRGIKTIYMENGYFSNTLQADTRGVNLSALNRDYSFSKIKNLVSDTLLLPSVNEAPDLLPILHLNKWDQLSNFLHRVLDNSFYAKYPELRGSNWFKKRALDKARRLIPLDVVEIPSTFAFIPLQVHDDTQILINSPLFKDPKQFLRHCYQQIRTTLGKDFPIIVKEHPEDMLRYDYEDIRREFPDIIWLRKFDIDYLLDHAAFTLVINSSVGLQAIARQKAVIVYGDSIYSRDEICSFITDLSHSKQAIFDSMQPLTQERQDNIKVYLQFINQHFFFKGSWKNFSSETMQLCARRIHYLVNAT